MKIYYIAALLLFTHLCANTDFEVNTNDSLLHVEEKETLHVQRSNTKDYPQEESLIKPDPLLENVNTPKEEKPSLLEKIIEQMAEKKRDNNKSTTSKKVFDKSLKQSNEIQTPDPLLDEI